MAEGMNVPVKHVKEAKEVRMRNRILCDNGDAVEQWAKRVINYSSQYNTSTWAADCILGAPRVYPRYGDIHGAWAQHVCDANQFIEIEFQERLYITEVHIYETLNAGAVTKVSASDSNGAWTTLWEASGGPTVIQTSRIFQPELSRVDFPSNQLRLEVNCSVAGSWCELDSVKMKGRLMLLDSPPPLTVLSDHLYTLVNNKEFSDCSFLVEGEEVYAHRAILAARSDYFRAMFKHDSKNEKPVAMEDVSLIAFLGMMQYIYTNQIDTSVTPLHLVEISRVADRFQLSSLQKVANHYLSDEISVDNVIEIFREATDKLPVLDFLRKTCLELISRHMDLVSRTPGFCALPQHLMLEIVQEAAARLSIK